MQEINVPIEEYLKGNGIMFKEFKEQDSACISYGFEDTIGKVFVKYSIQLNGIRSLERAREFHQTIQDPILPKFNNSFLIPNGIALVYEWIDAENLYDYTSSIKREDTKSPHFRFRQLAIDKIIRVISRIYAFHVRVEKAGYVAVDFYDGCILYNFEYDEVHLFDLDEYQREPFILDEERLPGSRRFMSPEEFQKGALIDHQTNVYTMGQLALQLLSDGTLENWRGGEKLLRVIKKAVSIDREERYKSIARFYQAWITKEI